MILNVIIQNITAVVVWVLNQNSNANSKFYTRPLWNMCLVDVYIKSIWIIHYQNSWHKAYEYIYIYICIYIYITWFYIHLDCRELSANLIFHRVTLATSILERKTLSIQDETIDGILCSCKDHTTIKLIIPNAPMDAFSLSLLSPWKRLRNYWKMLILKRPRGMMICRPKYW